MLRKYLTLESQTSAYPFPWSGIRINEGHFKKKNKLMKIDYGKWHFHYVFEFKAWELAGFVAILVTLADETIQYHRRKICI